jgi:hypothetical protein
VTVIVPGIFLALTDTPSMGPSASDVTVPVNSDVAFAAAEWNVKQVTATTRDNNDFVIPAPSQIPLSLAHLTPSASST